MGSSAVALVLDRQYGQKLRQLATQMSVWIIDSPNNVSIARELWRLHQEREHTVTTFKDPGEFDDTYFEHWMDEIELHHGHYSQMLPFQELEVFGLKPTAIIEQVLADYDFGLINTTATGFRAVRRQT